MRASNPLDIGVLIKKCHFNYIQFLQTKFLRKIFILNKQLLFALYTCRGDQLE
jgi:hypothetical protein